MFRYRSFIITLCALLAGLFIQGCGKHAYNKQAAERGLRTDAGEDVTVSLPPADVVARKSGWVDKFNPVKLIGKGKAASRTLPTPVFKTPPDVWMEPMYRKSDEQTHPWTLPGLEESMIAQGGTAKDAWNLWLELRPCVWLQVKTVDGGEQGCYTKSEIKDMYPDHPLEMWNELVFKGRQLEQRSNPVKTFAKNHWKKIATAAGLAGAAYGGYLYREPIMAGLEQVLPSSMMSWLRGVTGVASMAPSGYSLFANGGRPAAAGAGLAAQTPEELAAVNGFRVANGVNGAVAGGAQPPLGAAAGQLPRQVQATSPTQDGL